MSAASCLLTRKQLRCSICLEVLTDPVTLPCAHNFCSRCITELWNNTVSCQCPSCQEDFRPRPELQVNTLISEVADQFRQSAQRATSSVFSGGNFGCPKCNETTNKAIIFCIVFMFLGSLINKMQDVVPPEKEEEEKKAELVRAEAEIMQMIQKNQLKLEEIKRSVDLDDQAAYGEIAGAVEVFTALRESVERGQDKVIKTIRKKTTATKNRAEGFVRVLEDEISELRQRAAEVELLSVAQLEEKLSKEMKNQMRKLLDGAELKRVQRYAVDVTLDPDSANPRLVLSDDWKQVKHGHANKDLPDNPKRFTNSPGVVGRQSFSKGRFYFEVGVKGKTSWELGLVSESFDRKSHISKRPQVGYWTIGLQDGRSYFGVADSLVQLSVKSKPQKVGVFVDCEGRLVSFYDANTAALIHSFTGCSFTKKLYPFFHPFNNDYDDFAPLVISPSC